MIAELVLGLSLVGLAGAIGERFISAPQRERLRDREAQVWSWIHKIDKINFSQRIRHPRVIAAMLILPIIFVASVIWMFPKATIGTILLFIALSAICAPILWWLSRSVNDRAFVIRFAVVIVVAVCIYQTTMYWLVSDIEGIDELLIFGPLLIAFKIFFSLIFGFVFFFACLPFITAKLASWAIYGAHWVGTSRALFPTICAVFAGLAVIYLAMVGKWS